MSQETITVARQFPIINSYVISPDGPIAFATAVLASNIQLNGLVGQPARMLETDPGVVSCCDNPPADAVSEVIKALA
jgi:hypothetical protein